MCGNYIQYLSTASLFSLRLKALVNTRARTGKRASHLARTSESWSRPQRQLNFWSTAGKRACHLAFKVTSRHIHVNIYPVTIHIHSDIHAHHVPMLSTTNTSSHVRATSPPPKRSSLLLLGLAFFPAPLFPPRSDGRVGGRVGL